MSVKVATNRFIVSSVIDSYSKLFSSVSNVSELGKYLVREAENAQVFRQTKKVQECGIVLSHIPSQEYQLIGQYYLAWSAYRNGENVQDSLEDVFERSRTCKTKSLIILAALEGRKGNSSTELRYLSDSFKLADNVAMKVKISRAMAVVKSKEGCRKAALRDLENIAPLIRYTTVQAQYDYFNSLAVELQEAGRIEEAQDVCKVVLASPLIDIYPEWRETGREIALRGYKSRSVVSLTSKKLENVLSLPERVASDAPVYSGRARVLNYLDWKKKMVKEPNGDDKDKLPEDMSGGDIVMEILKRISNDDMTDEERLKILDYTIDLISKRKKD